MPELEWAWLRPPAPGGPLVIYCMFRGSAFAVENPLLVLNAGLYPLRYDVAAGRVRIAWPPHDCTVENASKLSEWLATRGGLAVWQSQDLSDPGKTWTAPWDGTAKPHWAAGNGPVRRITVAADVRVCVDEMVRRFCVAVRHGRNGMSFKCTDGSTRRIRAAVAKAGTGAYHVFDYVTQEAVILRPVFCAALDAWTAWQTATLYLWPSPGGPVEPEGYVGLPAAEAAASARLEADPALRQIIIVENPVQSGTAAKAVRTIHQLPAAPARKGKKT